MRYKLQGFAGVFGACTAVAMLAGCGGSTMNGRGPAGIIEIVDDKGNAIESVRL